MIFSRNNDSAIRAFSRAFALAAILVSAYPTLAEPNSDSDAFQIQVRDQDYSIARKTFQTHLVRRGGSEPFVMPKPPAGAQEIVFPSANMHLRAWVGRPAENRTQSPVVIFLHGGFAFGADDFEMAQPYRQAGFTVVSPVLRGEDGQPGLYSMFYDEVDDVLALVDYLRAQSWVDHDHIFLAGHSVGGRMAMLSGMSSDHIKAIASLSGSPDQFDFILRGGWTKVAPFDLSDPKEFELRSPLAFPGSFKAPARLYYGSQESFFRPRTQRLANLAKLAGKDVKAVEMPGDHFSAVPAEIADSITFFRSHM